MANCEEQKISTGLSDQTIKQQLKFNIKKGKVMHMEKNNF